MVQITKSEAKIVRMHYPDACIVKTRHKRYLEESEKYLKLIPGNMYAQELLNRMNAGRKRKREVM